MIKIIEHPIIEHYLSKIRDKNTKFYDFKRYVNHISQLMAFDVYKSLDTKAVKFDTPVVPNVSGKKIANDVIIVPILRAGLGISEGFSNVFPEARIGCVGMRRNEKTFEPEEYMYSVPSPTSNSKVIVVDPMLATGGSAEMTISHLKQRGFNDITLAVLVGVDEGLKKIEKLHPEINIFLAAKDEKLNDKKYIVPGLGDAGDRIFGTEN